LSEALLEFWDISYAYEEGGFALQPLSLTIQPGERLAVLGGNGAGKSTFFLCCNGVLTPDSGRIFFRGREVTRKKTDLLELRKNVGIVFQDPNQQLIASTVEDEISFGPMNLRLPPQEVASRVEEALMAMNLGRLRERPPHYLSGGEKKRVSIADVLAMEPELILFDEPTASLDGANIEVLDGILAKLSQGGKTLMVSTHDVDFCWRWASRVLVFRAGRLVADDLPHNIFSDDALLKSNGLQKPVLLEVTRMLEQKSGTAPGVWKPKNLAGLNEIINAVL